VVQKSKHHLFHSYGVDNNKSDETVILAHTVAQFVDKHYGFTLLAHPVNTNAFVIPVAGSRTVDHSLPETYNDFGRGPKTGAQGSQRPSLQPLHHHVGHTGSSINRGHLYHHVTDGSFKSPRKIHAENS